MKGSWRERIDQQAKETRRQVMIFALLWAAFIGLMYLYLQLGAMQ